MKILLTGATGLLGNNVLEQLLLYGHEVTALVRDSKRVVVDLSPYVGHYNIKVGDITNIDDLRLAASGCDAIVNCAGLTDMTLRHLKDYYPVVFSIYAVAALSRSSACPEPSISAPSSVRPDV